jgi:hypothetical protein
MAVKGLDLFSEYFKDDREAFVLIGGAACDLWFTEQNLPFRATRDLDVVLILENLTPDIAARFWGFIQEGQYVIKSRSQEGPPVLYRFAQPGREDFPFMVELFCRNISQLDLGPGQQIIPVRMEDAQSLSAILLHESYYQFLLAHCRETRGIMAADGTALIPLKARAWLDLTARAEQGGKVKERDIKKHRNDVFSLAVTLPGDPSGPLPDELVADVSAFLERHPPEHEDWDAIRQAIRSTIGGNIQPEALVLAIRTYYQLREPL